MKEYYDFQRVTASKSDLAHRTLLYGVGVNDSWYKISQKVNEKYLRCPIIRGGWVFLKEGTVLNQRRNNLPTRMFMFAKNGTHSLTSVNGWRNKIGEINNWIKILLHLIIKYILPRLVFLLAVRSINY